MFDSLDNFVRIGFEFIVELLFLASVDDINLPGEVSVLDLFEFLELVNKQFENPRGILILQDHRLGMASIEEVEAINERIFGELWPEVEEKIILSEENLDAHPLLFKMDVEKVIKHVPGRESLTILRDKRNRNDLKALGGLESRASLRSSLRFGPCISRVHWKTRYAPLPSHPLDPRLPRHARSPRASRRPRDRRSRVTPFPARRSAIPSLRLVIATSPFQSTRVSDFLWPSV